MKIITKSMRFGALALACLGLSSVAEAGWQSETVIGGKLNTILYVPTTAPALAGKRALMVSLHGCAQGNDDYQSGANWQATADAYGMVVALPDASKEGTYGSLRCWNFHVGMNMSRTSSDAKYLLDMVDELLDDTSLNIDPDQVYITGLSSGGGMTASMGCLAPEVFAGVGVNAGPGPGSDGQSNTNPNISIPQGVINCETLSNKNNANSQSHLYTQVHNTICGSTDGTVVPEWCDRLSDIMAATYDEDTPVSDCSGGSNPTSIPGNGTVNTFCDAGGPRSSNIIVQGMGHAWPAGQGSSGSSNYIDHSHVNYPEYVTAFFFDNNRRVITNKPPEITLVGSEDIAIISGSNWTDPGATATDEEDGDLTSSIVVSGSVNTNVIGVYTLTYSVTDSGGLPASVDRIVRVLDGTTNLAPTITLNGAAVVSVGSGDAWNDPGATANDNEDGDLTSSIVKGGDHPVNTAIEGTYSVTYTVMDNGTQLNGQTGPTKSTTVTRTVNVVPKCWTAPTSVHVAAGRAETSGGYVCQTVGGGDQLPQYTYTCDYVINYGGDTTYSIMETSSNVFNKVESCNVSDSDGDGVIDSSDACPNTPAGNPVNASGCTDTDGDGVADTDDQCPGTPAGATVDANGCESNGICTTETTYNYYHKTAGRAYSTGSTFSPNYFANGSDDPMAGSTWGSTSLYSTDGSTWYVGTCP
ncbi:MAG: PHB depolymerase family esterase [Cellvibrionaceae bacterium]